jgi:putative membrane protein
MAAIPAMSEVNDVNYSALLNALVYSVLGIVIFAIAFAVIDKLTPYHLWKEIVEDKNIALAVLIGAFSIGMCIIIAAAVH